MDIKKYKILYILLLTTAISACSSTDENSDTDQNESTVLDEVSDTDQSEDSGTNTSDTIISTTSSIPNITGSLPYNGTLVDDMRHKYKVSDGEVGEIYAVTLHTPTISATLDLGLYADDTYKQRIEYDVANILHDATLYVEALSTELYMLVGDTFSQGGSYDFVLDVEGYDSYAGLIDITGVYPYAGTTESSLETPYQVSGLEANTTYTITFSNVTSEIDVIGTNDKMKMIDKSFIPCSRYITTSTNSCTVTTNESGDIYIHVRNPAGRTTNYDIDITL